MARGQLEAVVRHLRHRATGAEAVSDAELLGRFAATGDEGAFELLVWRHARLVLGVCRRVLNHDHDAEDAFQATFLIFARRARSISRGAALGGWLARVALRVALRTRRPRSDELTDDNHPTAEADPAASAAWREVRGLLDHELNLLPDKYRLPLILCSLEGRTQEEAARELGCLRGTVAMRLTRGRDLLRRRLLRRGVSLSAAAALVAGVEAVTASPALLNETVKNGLMYAACGSAVTTPAAALAKGVLRTMWLSNLKTATACVLLSAVVLTGVGVGLVGQAPLQGQPPPLDSPRAGEPPPPAAPKLPLDPPPPLSARSGDAPSIDVLRPWFKRARELDHVILHFDLTHDKQAHEGTMKFFRPDKFDLEMRGKDQGGTAQRYVWDGETTLMMVPQQKIAVRENLGRGEWPRSLLLLGLNPEALVKRFDLAVAKEDQWYLYITMTPRAEADKELLRQARLVLNKETWLPRQLWVLNVGDSTINWEVVKTDTKTPLKPEDFRFPELPGWVVTDRQAGGDKTTTPPPGPKLDLLDDLVGELVKSRRDDGQAVEALYLATLARYPSETEKALLAERLAARKDRREALAELARQLTGTQEFRRKIESWSGRAGSSPAK